MGEGSRGFFVKVRVLLPPQVFPLEVGGGGEEVAGDPLSRYVSCFHLRYFRGGGGGGGG